MTQYFAGIDRRYSKRNYKLDGGGTNYEITINFVILVQPWLKKSLLTSETPAPQTSTPPNCLELSQSPPKPPLKTSNSSSSRTSRRVQKAQNSL